MSAKRELSLAPGTYSFEFRPKMLGGYGDLNVIIVQATLDLARHIDELEARLETVEIASFVRQRRDKTLSSHCQLVRPVTP